MDKRINSSKTSKVKNKYILLLLSVLMLTPVLGGCQGKSEVDELGYVIGIGVDLGQKPGYYAYTYQFAEPQAGESGVQVKPLTITIEAKNGREARSIVNQVVSRRPFVGTTRVIVIGEEAAKTGIDTLIETAQRYYEYRRTLHVVVAKGRAEDLLKMDLDTANLVALHIVELVEQGMEESRIPTTRLGHFLTVRGSEGKEPILALVEQVEPQGSEIRYQSESGKPENMRMNKGVAFREDKLELMLTEQETEGALYLLNEVKHKVLSVYKEDVLYAGTMIKFKSKPKVVSQNGTIGVEYNIKATMDVEEIRDKQFRSYRDTQDLVERAKEMFAQDIEESCQKAIQRAKSEKLDFIGLGRSIQMKNNALWQELKNGWEERIASIPVTVKVEVEIRNIGTSYQSPGTNR